MCTLLCLVSCRHTAGGMSSFSRPVSSPLLKITNLFHSQISSIWSSILKRLNYLYNIVMETGEFNFKHPMEQLWNSRRRKLKVKSEKIKSNYRLRLSTSLLSFMSTKCRSMMKLVAKEVMQMSILMKYEFMRLRMIKKLTSIIFSDVEVKWF